MNAQLTDIMSLPTPAPPPGAMGGEPRVAANTEAAPFTSAFDAWLTPSAQTDGEVFLRAGATGERSPAPRAIRDFGEGAVMEDTGWSPAAHLLSTAVAGKPTASLLNHQAAQFLPGIPASHDADALFAPTERPETIAILREDGLTATLDGESVAGSPPNRRLSTGSERPVMMQTGSRDAAGSRVLTQWGAPIVIDSSDAPADAASGDPVRTRIDHFRQFVRGPELETVTVSGTLKPKPVEFLPVGISSRVNSDSESDRTIGQRMPPRVDSAPKAEIGRAVPAEVESRGRISLQLTGEAARPRLPDRTTGARTPLMQAVQAGAELAETTPRVQPLQAEETRSAPIRVSGGEGRPESLDMVKPPAGQGVSLARDASETIHSGRTPLASMTERDPAPMLERAMAATRGSVPIVSAETATAETTRVILKELGEIPARLPRPSVRPKREPAGLVKPETVASNPKTGVMQSTSRASGQELVEPSIPYSGFVSSRSGSGPQFSANAAGVMHAGEAVTPGPSSVEILPLVQGTGTVPPHGLERTTPQAGDQGGVERIERFIIETPKPHAPPHRLVIQLEPPHLGRLRIDLSSHKGKVTGRLRFDTEAARALVQRSLPELHRALADAGIRIERLETAGPTAPRDGAAFITAQDEEQQSWSERNAPHQWPKAARGDDQPHSSPHDHRDTAGPPRRQSVAGLYRAALTAGHVDFVV